MPTWLLTAVAGTIGVTALLISVLYRINAPRVSDPKPPGAPAGDDAIT